MTAPGCPACAGPISDSDRYCERCGQALPSTPGASPAPPRTEPDTRGTRRIALDPRRARHKHEELDLGSAAVVSDRGRRHRHNEDAFALVSRAGRHAVVVCDGVSTTSNPRGASSAAARAAMAVIDPALDDPPWAGDDGMEDLLSRAIEQGCRAVARVPAAADPSYQDLPSTTIVAAIVDGDRAAVASVGDSRAYWLATGEGPSARLTVDDSWAEDAIAGGMAPDLAYAHPNAHVITQWLGADVMGLRPGVAVVSALEGVLVLCTDGLWNYFPEPEDLLAHAGGFVTDLTPLALARNLVGAALEAGGADNVTVAVIPTSSEAPATSPREE